MFSSDLLKYEICNRIWLKANQLVPLQTIASYMSSVVLVFSMLSLGRILISNLVVANLLMYSLPGIVRVNVSRLTCYAILDHSLSMHMRKHAVWVQARL